MVRVKRCCLCRKEPSTTVSVFRFPDDAIVAREWRMFCGIRSPTTVKRNTFLCSRHFASDCFKRKISQNPTGLQLVKGALPTLNRVPEAAGTELGPGCSIGSTPEGNAGDDAAANSSRAGAPDRNVTTQYSSESQTGSSKLKPRVCRICGRIDNARLRLRFFRFPPAKHAEKRGEWLHSLQLSQAELREDDRLCSRHFLNGVSSSLPTRHLVNSLTFSDAGPIANQSSSVPEPTPSTSSCHTSSIIRGTNESAEPSTLAAETALTLFHSDEVLTASLDEGRQSPLDNQRTADEVRPDESTLNSAACDTSFVEAGVNEPVQPSVTTPRSSKRKFRYFNDFSTPDLETPRRKRLCLQLGRSQLLTYRSRIDQLYHDNTRMKKRLEKVKDALATLQRRGLISDSAVEALKGQVPESMVAVIERHVNSKRRAKFPPVVRKFALAISFYSARAYEFLRKQWPALSAPSTIKSWYQVVDCRPGFTKTSFDALNEIAVANKSQGKETIVNLLIDVSFVLMFL